jgi:hypothetical protein
MMYSNQSGQAHTNRRARLRCSPWREQGALLLLLILALASAAACSGSPRERPDGGIDADIDEHDDAAVDADDAAADDADVGDAESSDGGGDDALVDGGGDADTSPVEVDPTVEGPFGVIEDEASLSMGGFPFPRTIDLDLYLPEDPSQAPYPVVIYSHGFQLSASSYVSLGQRLASHGVAAVLPSYGDNAISPRSHRELAADVSAIIDWISEQAGAEDGALRNLVDPEALGAGGHSRGGKHSILAAILDERIVASFNVDPVDVGHPIFGATEDYPSVTPELMEGFTIPGGFLGAGRSVQATLGQACAPEQQNYHQYFIAAPTPAFEYALPEAGHLDFTDSCGLICATCVAGDEPAWNHATATAIMVAFYRLFLASDERYRPWVDGAEITALSPRVALTTR